MFNYTKETIINDMSKVANTSEELIVKRGGNYKFANIVDKKVFKTVGVKGSVANTVLTVGTLKANSVYRFTMFVETPNQALADYAYPNWGKFGKIVLVEFTASGTANADATTLGNALRLSLQPDNNLFTVSVSEANVTVTMAENWMKIGKITFEVMENDEWKEDKNLTPDTTANKEDFATGKWLIENLRFPSYPNLRYNHLYSDESPIEGVVYDQYAFQYSVRHSVPGGLSSVGQLVDSITTHVFYVKHEDAGTFEGKFTGVTFPTAETEVSTLSEDNLTSDLRAIGNDGGVTTVDHVKEKLAEL